MSSSFFASSSFATSFSSSLALSAFSASSSSTIFLILSFSSSTVILFSSCFKISSKAALSKTATCLPILPASTNATWLPFMSVCTTSYGCPSKVPFFISYLHVYPQDNSFLPFSISVFTASLNILRLAYKIPSLK